MRPFLVHLYGNLQRLVPVTKKELNPEKEGEDNQIKLIKVIEHVDVSFQGYDCMSQLVRYLLSHGYTWSDTNYEKLGYPSNKDNIKVNNYLWAHNGFGFDWLYLFEPITKEMAGFKLIGDANKTKCFQGNGISLFDFKLIYNDTLRNIAECFFKGQPDMLKFDCDAVIDMASEDCDKLLSDG